MKKLSCFIFLMLITSYVYGDCIVGAKLKLSYVVLDANTIMLTGGAGPDIIIKSFSFFNSGSRVQVLKDSFCDFQKTVLYVDGRLVDVQEVRSSN